MELPLKKMWLNINGVDRMFICDPEKDSLAEVIRRLGLTGTKVGCGIGVCGACSIILNGKVVRSCTRKIKTIDEYSTVTTIEGIGTPNNLHPPAAGLDHLRRRTVRILHTRVYCFGLRTVAGEPEPNARRGAPVVPRSP